MNWRRGLFRLWIVGAAIFAIAVSCVSYGDIKAEFDKPAGNWWSGDPIVSAPKTKIVKFQGQLHEFPADFTDEEIAAALKSQPGMFEELKPVTDPAILAEFNAPPNPWAKVGMAAAIAFGIPLVVLVLGASLVWAFSGFAAGRSR
jgi:hypothetical protein